LLLFLPDRKTGTMEMVQKTEYKAKHPVQTMDVDEFAFRLLDRDPKLAIIDLRSSDAFKESPLPGSVSATLRDLFGKELLPLLSRRHVVKVFLADDIEKAEAAYRIADRLGFENIRVLDGGMKGFEAVILKHEGIEKANADTKRFRERAGTQLPVMMTEYKAKANRKPKVQKKIQGGC
jgi:rhodanese-related sulfurtransferase